MKLKSQDLLNLIDTGLVRNIAEFLAEQLSDFEKEWESYNDDKKKQILEMISHYNEAAEIYNSCSVGKIEKLKFPKNDPHPKTGGIDKYFKDLEEFESHLYCNKCGEDEKFHYRRTVSNGEVYHCESCDIEKLVNKRPNEDNY